MSVAYSAPTGTPILATADGRVHFASASAGYCHTILIDHTVNGQRIPSGYAHMFGERISTGNWAPLRSSPRERQCAH